MNQLLTCSAYKGQLYLSVQGKLYGDGFSVHISVNIIAARVRAPSLFWARISEGLRLLATALGKSTSQIVPSSGRANKEYQEERKRETLFVARFLGSKQSTGNSSSSLLKNQPIEYLPLGLLRLTISEKNLVPAHEAGIHKGEIFKLES